MLTLEQMILLVNQMHTELKKLKETSRHLTEFITLERETGNTSESQDKMLEQIDNKIMRLDTELRKLFKNKLKD